MKEINNAVTVEDTAYEAASKDTAYEAAYGAAKELAESYVELLKQKESYRGKLGKYPHYTMDDIFYLLTQGAHDQTERVQTSRISDPVSKAVINAEKLLKRLNAEMDTEYKREVVEPYMEICEKIHLFELCMSVLSRKQYHIADQLYILHIPKKYITDVYGKKLSRGRLSQETEIILKQFAEVLSYYNGCRKNGQSLLERSGDSG